MADTAEGRVAVYIDFDNIVISRYHQIHGHGTFIKEKLRDATTASLAANPEVAGRLDEAQVDIGAIIDYASSFGSIVISRAYADWSIDVNSNYKSQLIERAIDLVQLFPTVKSMKNGADIRLAVDAIEDLFRLPDLTHVVIVAGDSDYIALAQRTRKLGRTVVGIGVAGATSSALASACDRFEDYDNLPGLDSLSDLDDADSADEVVEEVPTKKLVTSAKNQAPEQGPSAKASKQTNMSQQAASKLLVRAVQLAQSNGDADWFVSSAVKNQMLRMNPSFAESGLGYKNFSEFVKSRGNLVELKEDGLKRLIRLRQKSGSK